MKLEYIICVILIMIFVYFVLNKDQIQKFFNKHKTEDSN